LLDLSSTWLLLRITGLVTPVFVQRLPNVPMQQTVAPRSLALPPEVPSFTGAVWAKDWSLGKIVAGGGVGVGAGVLLLPPQPTAPISTIDPNRIPSTFDIALSPFRQELATLEGKASLKFYARLYLIIQSSGTSVTLDAGSPPDAALFSVSM